MKNNSPLFLDIVEVIRREFIIKCKTELVEKVVLNAGNSLVILLCFKRYYLKTKG